MRLESLTELSKNLIIKGFLLGKKTKVISALNYSLLHVASFFKGHCSLSTLVVFQNSAF